MSKVYNYYMEMNELANDAEYQEYLAELEHKAQSEAYGMDNMEDNKAMKFAKKILEE